MTSSPPVKRFNWENLRLRLVSGFLLAPVVFALIWFGGPVFFVMLAVAGAFLAVEWGLMTDPPTPARTAFLVTAAVLAPFFFGYMGTVCLGAWLARFSVPPRRGPIFGELCCSHIFRRTGGWWRLDRAWGFPAPTRKSRPRGPPFCPICRWKTVGGAMGGDGRRRSWRRGGIRPHRDRVGLLCSASHAPCPGTRRLSGTRASQQ